MNQNNILGDSFFNSKFFNPDYLFNQGISFFHQLSNYTFNANTIALYHTGLFFLALFFLTIISYCIIRMFEIRKKEHTYLQHEIAEYARFQAEVEKKIQQERKEGSENERWAKTLTYLFSQSSSDWKLAIIEADSMLDGLMDRLGFRSENLGEKLKMANQDNFPSLTNAWEVHTIRNKIAHEGLSFELSQHEAKRIIALYEQIFRQYGFI